MRQLIITILCATAVCSAGDMFTVTQGTPENFVTFTSKAPLEEIVGKTNVVTGYVTLADGISQGSGEIHVDLASLDTGMGLRNKHMRENHLETDRYPEAVFTLTSMMIPGGMLQPGVRTSVAISGTLALHGISHEVSPSAYLTLSQASDELTIESSFTILLQDYSITRPEFLVMKLAEDQRIDVKLVARRAN